MKKAFKLAKLALCAGVCLVAAQANAAVTGTINQIDATSGGNLGLRVYLTGAPNFCSANLNWAYLEPTDSNYDFYASLLLTAWIQNKTVYITSFQDGAYCHIQYVLVYS
ncbi:hypothetical protein [Sphingomonas crusticola]|uniref:hypothetical protein n=1 Tax=Sphingomonas crusticola TaxID=1697973 RepID=UPI000E21D37C|nr:hypothetical protein [Sphingomonas crusticola]